MRGISASLLLALAFAAPAAADTLDVLRENTLVLRSADGGVTTLLLAPTGSHGQQVNASGVEASLFWSIKEGRFCWTARGAASVCIALPADKDVGDTWDMNGPTGAVVWTASIAPGRANLKAIARELKAAQAVDSADHAGH